MKSKFPLSLENIPKQESFACLSLQCGSILSALLLIFYSIYAVAVCLATLIAQPKPSPDDEIPLADVLVVVVALAHTTTLFLSTLMLVGAICEKTKLIKPWVVWTTLQVILSVIMLIFWSTMGLVEGNANNNLLLFVMEFLSLVIKFYMLVIVSSLYKRLEEERTERLKQMLSDESWYSSM